MCVFNDGTIYDPLFGEGREIYEWEATVDVFSSYSLFINSMNYVPYVVLARLGRGIVRVRLGVKRCRINFGGKVV